MSDSGVGVYFNEPQFEGLVDHEVHTEQLEVKHLFFTLLFLFGFFFELKKYHYSSNFRHISSIIMFNFTFDAIIVSKSMHRIMDEGFLKF